MNSELCRKLCIKFPLFGFSHCRDVVAEVSKAGGFGVLGAASTRSEARQLARRATRTLEAPASALEEPDVVEDCVSAYGPNVADLSVRNMDCSEADDLTGAVIGALQPGVFEAAGFTCQILGDYGPSDGSPILGASDIRCTQGDQAFRFSWGD